MYDACRALPRLAAVLTTLVALPVAIDAQQSPGFADTRSRLVRLHVDRLATSWQEAHEVPGLVVALVKGRRPLLVAGYGVADITTGVPMDPEHTLVHASSLAMPLTATALLQLVDAGLLDLDLDVNVYLQSLRIPQTFASPVTARHLLLHSAGFDSRVIARQVHQPEDLLPLERYLSVRMPPRVRPPGEVGIYSEHGYALAGLLIEEVADSPFAVYMRRNVFAPLGMHHSTFDWTRGLESSLATGYGLEGTVLEPLPRDLHQTVPASMLATTASEAARWMLALLNGGTLAGYRILSRESASLMLSRQFTHHRSLAGLGFGLRQGRRFESGEFFQAGASSGFTSAVVLLPDRRLGLFVAANTRTSIWRLIDTILQPFVDRAPEPRWPEPPTEPGPFDASGYYREAEISQTSIEKLATLIRQDRIVASADGGVVWRSHTFRPAEEPLLYREMETGEPLAEVVGETGARYLASPWGLMERVTWLEARPVQLILWVLFAAILLAASTWPAGRVPRYQPNLTPTDSFLPRWPFYCAAMAALFHLVFLVTLTATLAWALGEGARSLAYGVPFTLRLLLCLPLIGGALTLPAALGVAQAWRRDSWTFGYRLRLTLTVAALILFLPFLHSWNLLGFRF